MKVCQYSFKLAQIFMNNQSLSIQFQTGSNIYETNKVCQISFKLASLQEWKRHKSYGHENSGVLQGIWTRMQLNTSRTSGTPEHAETNNPGGETFFLFTIQSRKVERRKCLSTRVGGSTTPQNRHGARVRKKRASKDVRDPLPPSVFFQQASKISHAPLTPKAPVATPIQ